MITAKDLPTLPANLLVAIGEYGMARTDRANQIEIDWRWQRLIKEIKDWTAAQIEADRQSRGDSQTVTDAPTQIGNLVLPAGTSRYAVAEAAKFHYEMMGGHTLEAARTALIKANAHTPHDVEPDTGKAIRALKTAQNNLCARRPFGASSDPNSPDYDHDAFMWDFYQSAIDSLTALKPAEPCKHEYYYFGDQPFRRCNKCREVEPQSAEQVKAARSGGGT